MRAEIISIGSELTTGQNLDTNSQWLSLRLAEIGIPVIWHTTVADDLDANLDAFRLAARRARLGISTGGRAAPHGAPARGGVGPMCRAPPPFPSPPLLPR